MKKLLMCKPDYFNVIYDINPWMTENQYKVDIDLAQFQWNELYKNLNCFIDVELIDGVKELPDLVFTANAGFISGNNVIMTKFSKLQRRGEEPHFKSWFENRAYNVIHTRYNYEGAGDHLVDSQNRHWVANGLRTEAGIINELRTIISDEMHQVTLIDANWYHLDTVFCPLADNGILWYPHAFSFSSQQLIRNKFKASFEVKSSDVMSFCCNTVIIDNYAFVPKNTNISALLTSLGYRVFEFDLSEFMKSGGAAKCLTLEI